MTDNHVEAVLEAQRAQLVKIPWVHGESTYINQTLNTPETVPRFVLVYDKPTAPHQRVEVLRGIVTLGSGLSGHVDICHGGITTTILDEMMGLLVVANLRRQAIPGPAYMTAYLNTTFLRPVAANRTYVVVARIAKLEGRKLFITDTLEDGDGMLLAKGEGMFVRLKEKIFVLDCARTTGPDFAVIQLVTILLAGRACIANMPAISSCPTARENDTLTLHDRFPPSAPLDWNSFFRLRKQRRRWQLGFSVVLGVAGSGGGALFLSTGAAEWAVSLVPLEQFVTLGLMTTGFGLLGWLAGPSCGSLVFNALNRQHRAQMLLREVQFFARIKKHRVDPTASSMSNPVPDYYGEKISSVAGYRQWLKDQRAFNKKRTTFVR
ncbi:hypothetical protein P8C59_003583 [Phyllachora maydis]|uniref:Presequence translocated-associated motor subunit PAM17 n=1 Tax=Phyllachora maydis TaxID=1825666 RepID=A0AAD9MCK4_9PEZI|nr:hypothetical protein P8C59_003583 [Phyllachora maydis]